MVKQNSFCLPAFRRGFHLITSLVEKELPELPEEGLLNLFIQHTSAGLTINENADPSVRTDFERSFNHLIPENQSYYTHVLEGSDDMPAHLKSSVIGVSLTVPIRNKKLALGIDRKSVV